MRDNCISCLFHLVLSVNCCGFWGGRWKIAATAAAFISKYIVALDAIPFNSNIKCVTSIFCHLDQLLERYHNVIALIFSLASAIITFIYTYIYIYVCIYIILCVLHPNSARAYTFLSARFLLFRMSPTCRASQCPQSVSPFWIRMHSQ